MVMQNISKFSLQVRAGLVESVRVKVSKGFCFFRETVGHITFSFHGMSSQLLDSH